MDCHLRAENGDQEDGRRSRPNGGRDSINGTRGRSGLREYKRFWKLGDIDAIGDRLAVKEDGVIRFFYENFDGLPLTKRKGTFQKYRKLDLLRKRLELDVIGGTETQMNWNRIAREDQLKEKMGDAGAKIVTSHNMNECVGARQQGGTCTMAFGDTASLTVGSGCDTTGLGRWSWISIRGARGGVTRVLTAYQPVRARKGHSTVYSQHRRYFRRIRREGCPRDFFKRDLLHLLRQWRAQGDRLIVMMDGNENMNDGKLEKELSAEDLDMHDVVRSRRNCDGPATWFRGSKQIDAIWATKDIGIIRAAFLPFWFGIGDHRSIFFDVRAEDLLQQSTVKVKIPAMRRLKCDSPLILRKYQDRLEDLWRQHRIPEKLQWLSVHGATLTDRVWSEMSEKVDHQKRELMQAAESRCRRLCTGNIPFSPDLTLARLSVRVWEMTVKSKEGFRINKPWLRRKAKACKIVRPLQFSLQEAKQFLDLATDKVERMVPVADELRDKFLKQLEDDAIDEAERKARIRMRKKEELRRSWRITRKTFGKPNMGSVKEVEIRRADGWMRKSDRVGIERGIMEENAKRFRLTEGTPFMTREARRLFGLLAETGISQQVLDGDIVVDSLGDDVQAFLRLFSSSPRLEISDTITEADFCAYWKKAKERTASSISGLHFGHYKAASSSPYLAQAHALQLNSVFKRGIPLDRWTRGLSCMLEKEAGVIRVDKLRAILLLEADFNFANKLLVGKRMVDSLEESQAFEEEQYGSRRQRSSIEVALNRRLLSDLSRQKRRPIAIAGVDAAHCYDRVAHPFAVLACRAVGVKQCVVHTIFSAVQRMKMKVRTAFGESDDWYGGTAEAPFQGLCQGNMVVVQRFGWW